MGIWDKIEQVHEFIESNIFMAAEFNVYDCFDNHQTKH